MQLLRHLEGLMREEGERGWAPPEGQEGSRVLGSANQLFLKIRASLQRCVKLVSRGNTLLRLSGAFKVGGRPARAAAPVLVLACRARAPAR